ncbi:MAG: rhomboid family intramembrane serine protease [Oscillospiraceae bacterium]|nr:rhomboid family intramembrane serine protease [Oscillospiraceae bacterium]
MKSLRNRFERFCYRHRNKGIPNLMLYISLGTALVFLMSYFAQNYFLYSVLCFDRELILRGQVWRLITYPLTYSAGSLLFTMISLVCYWSLGKAMENVWGTCRSNLYYLCGILMMDVFCMIFGGRADAAYLNLSLMLGYATMYPNAQFLVMFIIPVRAWVFGVLYLAFSLIGLITDPFPVNLFSVICFANYFLFFGQDVANVLPMSWRANFLRLFRKRKPVKPASKPIPFPSAGSYEASVAKVKAPYNHRCTICGRTDVSDPQLEFRYCSRCNGYYCYCQDHISDHAHIQ